MAMPASPAENDQHKACMYLCPLLGFRVMYLHFHSGRHLPWLGDPVLRFPGLPQTHWLPRDKQSIDAERPESCDHGVIRVTVTGWPYVDIEKEASSSGRRAGVACASGPVRGGVLGLLGVERGAQVSDLSYFPLCAGYFADRCVLCFAVRGDSYTSL
jgi:hypothetical protein